MKRRILIVFLLLIVGFIWSNQIDYVSQNINIETEQILKKIDKEILYVMNLNI